MVGFLCAFVLLLLLIYLLFSRFSIIVIYENRTFIILRYACFSIRLYPRKKSKQKSQIRNRKALPYAWSVHAPVSPPAFLVKQIPTIWVSIDELHVHVGGKDAYQIAINALTLENTLIASIQLIQQLFHQVHVKSFLVFPYFYQEKTTVSLHLTISFRFYQLVKFLFLIVLHTISTAGRRGMNLERGEGYAR